MWLKKNAQVKYHSFNLLKGNVAMLLIQDFIKRCKIDEIIK